MSRAVSVSALAIMTAPVAVVLITLNEAHHMEEVMENLSGFASEVYVLDSFSTDETVAIARRYGAHVVQREFTDFADQWNYALSKLPIRAPWTMKMDPDERLSGTLKESLRAAFEADKADAMTVDIQLAFLGKLLPVRICMLRVWRTGTCRFDGKINEHAVTEADPVHVRGVVEHWDSPDLAHWFAKQNRYSTAEAKRAIASPSVRTPSEKQRPLRAFLKRNWSRIPFRYFLLHVYHLWKVQPWRSGRTGLIWARLRTDVYRWQEFKAYEMRQRERP